MTSNCEKFAEEFGEELVFAAKFKPGQTYRITDVFWRVDESSEEVLQLVAELRRVNIRGHVYGEPTTVVIDDRIFLDADVEDLDRQTDKTVDRKLLEIWDRLSARFQIALQTMIERLKRRGIIG